MPNETPYDMLGTEIQTPTEKLVNFKEIVEEGDTMGAMDMLPGGDQLAEVQQRPPPPVTPPVQSNIPPAEPKKEISPTTILQNPVFVANAIKGITPTVVQEGVKIAEVKQDETIEQAKVVKLGDMLQERIGQKRIGGLDRSKMNFDAETATAKDGGLIGMAAGGNFQGQVQGRGHGMEDNVFMPIVERNRGQQVATLAVSPKEYVVDAHTMSALGNGNPDAGAKYMDRMVKNIREKAYGTEQQPNEINGLASLRPMMERV